VGAEVFEDAGEPFFGANFCPDHGWNRVNPDPSPTANLAGDTGFLVSLHRKLEKLPHFNRLTFNAR